MNVKSKQNFFQSAKALKHFLGFVINRSMEQRFGLHLRLKGSFPYLAMMKARFLTVRMDVINKCNLHCKMCYFSLDHIQKLPRRDMPLELFRKIADDIFPITRCLILSAGAEPLLASSFPEMLDIATQYEIPETFFATNGMLLTQEKSERIIQAGVHHILISFDGATPQTYEAIRRGSDFERVTGNIRRLQALKQQHGSQRPVIHFSTVLMRRNIRELPELLVLAHDLGVACVEAMHLVPYAGLDMQQETLNHEKALTNTYLDQSRALAEKLGITLIAPPNFRLDPFQKLIEPRRSKNGSRCQFPWHEILINPEGTVYPCCYWFETTSMGNFRTLSFKEIWQGAEYQKLRNQLQTHSLRSTCRNCPIIYDCNDDRIFSEITIQRGV